MASDPPLVPPDGPGDTPAGTPEGVRVAAVVVAAGSGTRVGAPTNKVLLPLRGLPVLAWSLRTLGALAYVETVVVVARSDDVADVAPLLARHLRPDQRGDLVEGGPTRHDSEWRGLCRVRADIESGAVDVVVVHDAARPMAPPALFDATVRVAWETGGALPVRPQPGLLAGLGETPSDRALPGDTRRHVEGLVGMQTPQAFRAGPLLTAYAAAERDAYTGTDTAGCVAVYTDLTVLGVPAPATNLKITFPEDLALAERLLG